MSHLPTIGIIGGAGPEAGALLFRQIIRVCQEDYNCWHDRDFPLIQMISYPFSEMLHNNCNASKILEEVKWVYNKLDTDFVVIACNTLHRFLDGSFSPAKFYHLIEETASSLKSKPLLICTSTSREAKIHESFFDCCYSSDQERVDSLIDTILKGSYNDSCEKDLIEIIASSDQEEVVLGCTELSLVHDRTPLSVNGKTIIDPSWIAAKKITNKVFN